MCGGKWESNRHWHTIEAHKRLCLRILDYNLYCFQSNGWVIQCDWADWEVIYGMGNINTLPETMEFYNALH